jgi:hypothetical protein
MHLASTAWALARLRHRPSDAWLQRLAAAAQARGLATFGPREGAVLLWAFSKLGYQPPPDWLAEFWAASGGGLGAASPAELCALAVAACRMRSSAQAGAAEWTLLLAAAVRRRFPHFSAQEATVTLRALAELAAGREVVVGMAAAAGGGGLGGGGGGGAPALGGAGLAVGGPPPGLLSPAGGVEGMASAAPAGRTLAPRLVAMQQRGQASQGEGGATPQRPQQQLAAAEAPRQQPLRVLPDQPTWLESFVSQAFGVAALLSLMPEGMQARHGRWPARAAAAHAQRGHLPGPVQLGAAMRR